MYKYQQSAKLYYFERVYNTMNFSVKHEILSKSIINKAAFNQKKNVICCILDGIQNVAFYQLDSQGQFQQVKIQNARPLAINNILSWSPNGNMLALGQTKVEVWNFTNSQLSFFKLFNQQFTQIRTIVWAADSNSYACIGLHKQFSIIVRNVNTSQLKSINLETIVASISFDPFGKYLFALTLDNRALILRNNLEIIKSVNLSGSPSKNTPVKEIRIATWSTDYSCVFTPSLEDSKIPIAVSLSRSKDFKVNQIIVGHPSSINCITFNPKLFEAEGQIIQIVAIGDTSGFISIWKIGKQKKCSQPLLLSRSHQNSDEVIQYLQWDCTGSYLLVHSHKKYLVLYKFDKKMIGKELNSLEFNNYLEKLYGASSAQQMRALDLPVFSAGQYKSAIAQPVAPQLANRIENNNPTNTFSKSNNIVGPTTTQTITFKTQQKNFQVNGKKHIIPSIKSTKPLAQNLQSGIQVPVMVNPIKLLKLSQRHKIKSIYKITQKSFLEIKNLSTAREHLTVIRLVQITGISSMMVDEDSQKVIHNQRAFQGDVDYLQITNEHIFLVNMANLYTFDKNLNVSQLPLCIGQLYELVLNDNLDAYGISIDGTVRGYNLRTRKMFCDTNLAVLLETRQNQENDNDPIEESQIGMDHQLYIRMSKNKLQYFLDLKNNLWNRLDFEGGNLKKGHSVRISKRQLNKNKEIFAFNPVQVSQNSQVSLTQLQYNLIYYKKYNPNVLMYYESIFNYIRELLKRNLQIQVRDSLLKYIFNSNSSDYIADIEPRQKIWQKIKSLGGKVIEEFVLLNS